MMTINTAAGPNCGHADIVTKDPFSFIYFLCVSVYACAYAWRPEDNLGSQFSPSAHLTADYGA